MPTKLGVVAGRSKRHVTRSNCFSMHGKKSHGPSVEPRCRDIIFTLAICGLWPTLNMIVSQQTFA